MEKYGSDKPDLRFGLEMVTLNDVFEKSEFRVFKDSIEQEGIITGLLAKGCGDYTRNQLDVLTDFVKKLGAGGLIWIRVKENELDAPIAKFLSDEEKKNLVKKLSAEPGDLLFILTGKRLKTSADLKIGAGVLSEIAALCSQKHDQLKAQIKDDKFTNTVVKIELSKSAYSQIKTLKREKELLEKPQSTSVASEEDLSVQNGSIALQVGLQIPIPHSF